ncbi:MAG: hypothetical protein ACLFU6_03230 [Candidatus Hydrogenedentota bacterium]
MHVPRRGGGQGHGGQQQKYAKPSEPEEPETACKGSRLAGSGLRGTRWRRFWLFGRLGCRALPLCFTVGLTQLSFRAVFWGALLAPSRPIARLSAQPRLQLTNLFL